MKYFKTALENIKTAIEMIKKAGVDLGVRGYYLSPEEMHAKRKQRSDIWEYFDEEESFAASEYGYGGKSARVEAEVVLDDPGMADLFDYLDTFEYDENPSVNKLTKQNAQNFVNFMKPKIKEFMENHKSGNTYLQHPQGYRFGVTLIDDDVAELKYVIKKTEELIADPKIKSIAIRVG